MKHHRRLIVILVAVAITTCFLSLLLPQVSFRLALLTMSYGTSGGFYRNTFSDSVTSAEIGEMYYVACKRLEQIRGENRRRTYLLTDAEGYLGVFSIVQRPADYIYVGVFGGNDSDMIAIGIAPGTFSLSVPGCPVTEQKELADDRLPKGVIRPW